MSPESLVLSIVVGMAFAVQSTTGFGATILTLSIATALSYPILSLPPLLLPLSILQAMWVTARQPGEVDWQWIIRWVVPIMGGSGLIAFWLSRGLTGDAPRYAFAVLVLLLAIWEMYKLYARPTEKALHPVGIGALLAGAGIVHGIYTSGGPLLILASSRRITEKVKLRGTLIAIWLIINPILLVQFYLADAYSRETVLEILILVPSMALGTFLGGVALHRLPKRTFLILVYALLAAIGCLLLLR